MQNLKQKIITSLRSNAAAQPFVRLAKRMRPYITRKNFAVSSGCLVAVFALVYGSLFFWPRTIVLSFAGDNCVSQPLLLPKLITKTTDNGYSAAPQTSLSAFGYPMFSAKTCITPTKSPKEDTTKSMNFGSALFQKKIHVQVANLPHITDESFLERPVATKDTLDMKLSTTDQIFDYNLHAGDKDVVCSERNGMLSCDTEPLKLAQSKEYEFKLERHFEGQTSGTLFEQDLRTVQTVEVQKSSISNDQTVYSKPKQLVLTLNREVVEIDDIKLTYNKAKKQQPLATKATIDDKIVTITFEQDLPRDTIMQLQIKTIRAGDGGFLSKPYVLGFRTSGGPKVTGANIGTYKASPAGPFMVSFDTPLYSTANTQKSVWLEVGGKVFGASVSTQGNSAVISPTTALPRCTPFTIRVTNELKNQYDVSGGSSWVFNSRTICQSAFSIGASVKGRGIKAYSFGSGATKIVYIGGTHGDETSSVVLMNQWIESLESGGGAPAGKTIIVIPTLNPDGYANGTRNNARNVDLNRNFPANDWQADVTSPYGTPIPKGGGGKPLSEPESAAIANYLLSVRPRLVLTYHAKAGVVIPNGSGDSNALAAIYDQKSNLYQSSGMGVFKYETTGEMEVWLRDKAGIPCLLIELWTTSGQEFSGNQNAMWAMANL